MNIRVGQGFDIHRFNTEPTPGRLLILGGEVFEGMRSLVGHSDA
ncbi:MAG: 2-C-methyl-D-erythritol 2,4-cyclodiphosphate synthase, partial [Actinomycetota bacterium]